MSEVVNRRVAAKAQTRAKILVAARKLWAEPGTYEAITIRVLADAVGMSTGSIFSNWEGKADLWREAIRSGLLEVKDWHDLPGAIVNCNSLARLLDTIEALRNRTSEPAREAVAWLYVTSTGLKTASVEPVRRINGEEPVEVQPLFTHPAPATADKLRADIETALKNFDATSAMCPFNKSPTPPRDKPCPTCSAEKNEGCRREITAAFGFVYVARQALSALEGGEG